MATLKGSMRSMNAAINRMERDRQRQNREAARRFKEQQKLKSLMDAGQAVGDWEIYVHTLKSIHKDCSDKINWERIGKTTRPKEPRKSNLNANIARDKIEAYKPTFFDKIFGLTGKRIKKLEAELEAARETDTGQYEKSLEKHKADLVRWEELQEITKGILDRNPEFYIKVLEYYRPFDDVAALGAKINFSLEKDWIDIELRVNGNEVIPDYVLSQTSTGKLSKKNMPKMRFMELYQDHICSAVLRVAREVFALLPVDYVRVNAMSDILDTKTGFTEEKPVLSVIIRPETLEKINLQTVDPSDCMANFVHNMKFKKTSGFDPVEKVELG